MKRKGRREKREEKREKREATLIDSYLACFSISASASLHPLSVYTSSHQSSVSIAFSGISPFNYFHFSWFRSAVPFHVSTAFSFVLHFHFVSSFSTGVYACGFQVFPPVDSMTMRE